ncbi:MAG: glycosyltransferase family 4 protein [bacterium]
MRPLRFAMFTTFYPPYNFGGDGMGVQRLSQALVRRGHHVTVIHDADAYVTLANREPVALPANDGVEIVTLRSKLGGVSNLLTQQTGNPVVHGAHIREVMDAGNFDVTVFHNVSLVGGPGLLSYGRGATIYMAHEHWLVCPSHVLWRHNREVCTQKECLRCVLHYHRPPQLWRYTGYLERQLPLVDRFIAMSEFSRAKHEEFGFTREMSVVPYFLPDTEPAPVAAGDASPHDRPYFLFVGRLEKIKGLDDVIPVFGSFHRADLLVAGNGDYADQLRTLAAGNPRVRFLGNVPSDDLSRYYRHATALLVPSVCFETFGIIIIEAFRQGTPVVARRIGPFPEILDRAGAGDLFETPAELEAALHRYLDEPDRRARLSTTAVEAFKANWSESAVLPRFMDVVEDVLRVRNSSAKVPAP